MVFKLYHSGMCNSDLKSILEEFTQPDYCTRFIISTIAFGIGINIQDISYTGGHQNIRDYWQEVGRTGRDGKAEQAKMYATKVSLLNCSEEMKTLVKSEECYRQYGFVVGDSDIQGTNKSVWQ
ncbi:hypothetical protein DPMN_056034 [Dreissena polymorpha]|uniref:DNA 3'-5' helicase n=1 Tax=Dreissena polymorpha TaxID=45954 RepID=A0A9D4CTQ4_DREPO|nr:hypothetical protein DPMN_056034 [Dreissena polymorpha]